MPRVLTATIIAAVAAVATVLGVAGLNAQTQEEWRAATEKDAPPAATGPSLVQAYSGVKPGSGNPLPRIAELKGKAGLWLTWPGFVAGEDGASRIFLQTTGPLSYTQSGGGKALTLRFDGAKVYLRNNRNPLVTQHFNTPVTRVNIREKRDYVEVLVDLKVAVTPTLSQQTDADGYSYFFIDFPAGDWPRPQIEVRAVTEEAAPRAEQVIRDDETPPQAEEGP